RQAAPLGRAPLLDPAWRYVEGKTLDDFKAEDWRLLDRQRETFYAVNQANEGLRMLAASSADPGFGYATNNYRHSLPAGAMGLPAGEDEETGVVALLHDIGFIACPTTHGVFAAALLGPYVDERHHWMLQHHQAFQSFHCASHPAADANERERWRGHRHFGW